MIFGAWTGELGNVFADNSKSVIELAKRVGLTTLDVLINDGAKVGPFSLYTGSEDKIVRALAPISEAGLGLHVTTWVQVGWSKGLKRVGSIAARLSALGVTADCEESFALTAQRAGLKPGSEGLKAECRSLTNAIMEFYEGRVSATHIIFAPPEVRDFVDACDADIVQGYGVKKWFGKSKPGNAVRQSAKLWQRNRQNAIGLAAYGLDGTYGGMKARDAFAADIRTAVELGYREVRYWRAEFFRNADMAAALRDAIAATADLAS